MKTALKQFMDQEHQFLGASTTLQDQHMRYLEKEVAEHFKAVQMVAC